jgi:flagellar basal body rod protein FlgC
MLTTTADTSDIVECQTLATASYSLMDQGRYEETVALFSQDAVWVRGGKPFRGHEAILAALRQRPETMVSRHLVTNVLVERVGTDAARATACFIPLRGERREDGSVAMPSIESVGDLSFRFRLQADGWRITHLEPQPLFKT